MKINTYKNPMAWILALPLLFIFLWAFSILYLGIGIFLQILYIAEYTSLGIIRGGLVLIMFNGIMALFMSKAMDMDICYSDEIFIIAFVEIVMIVIVQMIILGVPVW